MTTTVILSGGLDSTVALASTVARSQGPVRALGFDYGQTHVRELRAAQDVTAALGVPYEVMHLRDIFSGSALIASEGRAIPRGAYEEENLEETVVHGRNMLFASLAVARSRPGDRVVLGVHGGDHDLYPDCRPDFWVPFAQATQRAYEVEVVTPFLHLTKADIVRLGASVDAPMGLSWSCYAGDEEHCGECGTCDERRNAFRIAGVSDPTSYVE